MKILLLISLLISFNSFADVWRSIDSMNLVNYSQLYLNAEDYLKAVVVQEKAEHVLTIRNSDGKEVYARSREAVFSAFKEVKVLNKGSAPILMVIWQKGVHGEQVELIDTKTFKTKLDKTSSWPIEVTETKKGIEVLFSGDAIKGKQGQFKKEVYLVTERSRVVKIREER